MAPTKSAGRCKIKAQTRAKAMALDRLDDDTVCREIEQHKVKARRLPNSTRFAFSPSMHASNQHMETRGGAAPTTSCTISCQKRQR